MTPTVGDSQLRTLRRATLAARTVDALREYIQASGLPVGAQLPPESELAGALGVSRNVLRQAVASLQTLGVVRVVHGSGTYLTDVAESRVLADVTQWLHTESLEEDDYFEVRSLWDHGIFALAMERASSDDLDRLDALAAAMADAADQAHFDVEHARFHGALLDATRNPFLKTVDSLLRKLFWEFGYQQGGVRKPPQDRVVTSHQQIADLLRTRDPSTIDSMITVHLMPD